MSTCVTSFHSTLGKSAHYEYARLQLKQAFVLTPMFYLMSLGLVWLDLHVLVIESQCYCSCPHTPQYRDILIPFFAWLGCQFTRAEGPWLNFPPRRMLGLSFVCTFASRMEVLLFSKCMWAYARVWSEVCRLKQSAWGSGGSPVMESSEENSADVVPLSNNSQIIPTEETAGYKLHEKA